MSKKSYRDILTRYIQEHKVEDAILTDQVVQYAAEELGKDAAEVKKAVNVTMARLEKDGYVIRLAKGVYCKKVKTAFGFYMPNKDDLFCRQLLQDKDKIIGYETGLSALNRLGLVSQMPKKICIASNLHQKRVPEGIQVEVRKPPIAVNIKQAIQVGFSVQRQQPVHLADIPVFFRIALVHIEDKGFQQVHFAAVPEVVALAGAVGVLDDDIHKELRHQFLAFHFGKAVPAV